MNHVLYIIPILLAVTIPSAFAQVETVTFPNGTTFETPNIIIPDPIPEPEILGIYNETKTHTVYITDNDLGLIQFHYPYFETEQGEFIPYRLTQNNSMIQVEFSDGKIVFDKNAGATTLFKNGIQVVDSDSYLVRTAQLDSDDWTFLDVNNSDVQTIVEEEGDKVTITFRQQNNEGIFDVEYVIQGEIKTTAKFTNFIYPNHKFAFTETLNLSDNIITLNDQEINLDEFVGQTFPREILEQNEDLVLETKDFFYNSGIGFDQLWNVGIFENNKIALDYANVEQTKTAIGETVELDPTWQSPTGGSVSATNCSGHNQNDFTQATDNANYASNNSNAWQGVTCGSSGAGSFSKTMTFDLGQVYAIQQVTTYHSGYSWWGGTNLSIEGSANSVTFLSHTAGNNYNAANTYIFSPTNTVNQQSQYISYTIYGSDGWKSLVETRVYVDLPTYAPTAPQSLTTSQSTANEIILNWSAPSSDGGASITNYKVYLGGSLIDTIGNVLTYTDIITGNEIGANLVYSVKAVNSVGDSPASSNSNISSWDVPDQVTGLTAQTGTPIILNWNVPASDDTITNYEIKRDSSVIATVGAVTTYSDSPPTSGAVYSYEISAISAVGQGAYSSAVNGIAGLPWNVPTNLSATVSDVNATPLLINLSWDASTQGSGTGTLTGYELFVDGVSIGTVGTVTSSTYQLSSPGTYDITIKSLSTHVNSATGNISSVTTPNAPGAPSLTLAINDPNNLPLDITTTFVDGPTGGSSITGFNLYYSSDDITYSSIVNNTNSDYTYSVSNAGTHYFKSEAINNIGTGTLSTAYSITTPNVPDAITDLSGNVISNTQINISWTAPNDQGSNIDDYKIYLDGTLWATTQNTSFTNDISPLVSNTSYTLTVYAVNSVGDSLVSNSVNLTTYQPVSGSITVTPNTQGATTQLTFSASGITGTPTPTFSTFTLKEGITVIASGITSPYTLTLNDNNSHTYTITSTDNTHWNTPTIQGNTTVTASYDPNWSNGISYNYTRASGVMDLTVNKDSQILWDATCNYKTTAQVMADQSGIVSNFTNVWYINDSQNIADTDTVYVSCNEDGTTLFSFTSFGPNRLGGGIAQLDAVFGEWTGTPVALIFVLLVAGLFTGRSAPTGILLVLALIGVLGFIGMLTIDEAVWGFLLLAGVLGIFLGKRFL